MWSTTAHACIRRCRASLRRPDVGRLAPRPWLRLRDRWPMRTVPVQPSGCRTPAAGRTMSPNGGPEGSNPAGRRAGRGLARAAAARRPEGGRSATVPRAAPPRSARTRASSRPGNRPPDGAHESGRRRGESHSPSGALLAGRRTSVGHCRTPESARHCTSSPRRLGIGLGHLAMPTPRRSGARPAERGSNPDARARALVHHSGPNEPRPDRPGNVRNP